MSVFEDTTQSLAALTELDTETAQKCSDVVDRFRAGTISKGAAYWDISEIFEARGCSDRVIIESQRAYRNILVTIEAGNAARGGEKIIDEGRTVCASDERGVSGTSSLHGVCRLEDRKAGTGRGCSIDGVDRCEGEEDTKYDEDKSSKFDSGQGTSKKRRFKDIVATTPASMSTDAKSIDVTTARTPEFLHFSGFPVPFNRDAIPDFKKVICMRIQGDPAAQDELEKLKMKWPSEGGYYHRYHKIPELWAYVKEVSLLPPHMKPGSFNIPLFNEGSNHYSIRLIPWGNCNGQKISFKVRKIYSLFIVKGTLRDGQVQDEIIQHPKYSSRFLVESSYADRASGDFMPAVPSGTHYTVRPSGNYRITDKEAKPPKVVYSLDTVYIVEDIVRSNASQFPFIES